MSQPSIHPDSPELREMLVAYLDGELDAESARQVEQLLAHDPRVEAELRQLQRAWDLLDRLPRAEVAPSFTRSTVEMAVLAVENELRAPTATWPTRRGTIAAAVLLSAGLAGFLGARLWPDANLQLLRDLPIVENLEAYRQTPEIDFLRNLQKDGLFAGDVEAAVLPADSLDERRRQLSSLGPDQREELHRKYERFVHLPGDEQERLRKLQRAIATDQQAADLEITLAAYEHWLNELPGVERAELMAIDGAQRFERVKRLRQEEAGRLGTEDVQPFVDWFQTQLLKWLPDPRRRQLQNRLADMPEAARRDALGQTVSDLRRRNAQNSGPGRRPLAGLGMLLVNSETRSQLYQKLSPRGRQQLDQIQSPDQGFRLMQAWIGQTLFPQFAGRPGQLSLPEVDDDEMRRFFEHDLDAAQRAQLLNLPADQMRRQLLGRYQAKRAAQLRQKAPQQSND